MCLSHHIVMCLANFCDNVCWQGMQQKSTGTNLQANLRQVPHVPLATVIDQLHLDFPFALCQQLIPDPVLVRKVPHAPLVWVVFAEDALELVAAVVSGQNSTSHQRFPTETSA